MRYLGRDPFVGLCGSDSEKYREGYDRIRWRDSRAMTLKDLVHGQEVRYRVRVGEAAPTEWATGHLYLRRREKDYRRGREVFPAGEIVELTIVERPDWATYTERDFDPRWGFSVEEFLLEIEGLK